MAPQRRPERDFEADYRRAVPALSRVGSNFSAHEANGAIRLAGGPLTRGWPRKARLRLVQMYVNRKLQENTLRVPTSVAIAILLTITGCAKTSTIALSANEVQVVVDAPPACGPTGAQQAAFRQAAVATIQRGFDRFTITAASGGRHASGIVHSPTTGTVIGNTVYQSGGISSIVVRHQSVLTVKMFRETDSHTSAIDARGTLGPQWRDIVAKNSSRVSC